MNKQEIQTRLEQLRIDYKNNPAMRDIITRQGIALKRALEQQVKDEPIVKFTEELFGSKAE